jgi:hypothetical protein
MTITFENDNDVIAYALEKVISYARKNQQIFVAQCVWWLASIIGLEQGLIIHIDNLRKSETAATSREYSGIVHPNRAQQIESEKAVSPTPRDLTEDRRLDQILKSAKECLAGSERIWNTWQHNRVNPLPQTKIQLKKARKVKRLQEANKKKEVERNLRLQEIRAEVIRHPSTE